MTNQKAIKIAVPVVAKVVDSISNQKYEKLVNFADFSKW